MIKIMKNEFLTVSYAEFNEESDGEIGFLITFLLFSKY